MKSWTRCDGRDKPGGHTLSDFHLRQMGIASPARLLEAIPTTTVIGAGGIGSSAAMALLKMGLEHVTVYDFDDLENHNLGNQFLPHCLGESFLGRKKVRALEALAHSLVGYDTLIQKRLALMVNPWAFGPGEPTSYLVVSGVDSMSTRKMIWERVENHCVWYIDGRMSAQQLDIYVVRMDDETDKTLYRESLYSDEEALQEPCTARGIIYTSLFAGAHIANIVKQIAVGPTPPRRLIHIIEHHLVNVVRR
jgi:hypothetical protein